MSPGGHSPALAVASVVIADFDRTLVRLFDDSELCDVHDALVAYYQSVDIAIPSSSVSQDPYALRWAVFLWATEHLPQKAAHDVDRQASRILAQYELRAARAASLLPGIDGALRTCKDAGVVLAVVSSNSRLAVDEALRRTGSRDYFEVVLGREPPTLMSDLKPEPDLVHAALARTGSEPGQALIVGDSTDDMKAGRAAGVTALGVRTGVASDGELTAAGGIAVIDSFADLPHKVRLVRHG